MCIDPFTLVAAGVSAAGSVMQASAQSSAYKQQAAFARRQALIEQQQGAYEAARTADQNTRALAGIRGAYAASGIALQGSAVDVLTDSATQASLDEQAIKYGAQLRSDNARFEASQADANARSARIGGIIGAITPFVNAGAQQSRTNQMRTMINNPYVMAAA